MNIDASIGSQKNKSENEQIPEKEKIVESITGNSGVETTKRKGQNLYPIEALKIDNSFYSVYELKRKMERAQIKLDADFQRGEVWSLKQRIELVESVLMGLPLPIFYFNRDSNGMLVVVDGRQRLGALFSYMNNKFSLKNLKVLNKQFEKKFSELDQIYQSKIEDFQIHAYEILPETPESVIFDIFDRVNRGGTRLNNQEIRNALYQGKSTLLLNKYAISDSFSKVTGDSLKTDKRQKSQYLLLRFIAFYLLEKGYLREKDGSLYGYKTIDDLLSYTMLFLNSLDKAGIENLEKVIDYAIGNCILYLDKDAFRLNQNGKRSPINMNVFEVVMYIMAQLPNTLTKRHVFETIGKLKKDDDFLISIGNHRDNEMKVKKRFILADKIVEELKTC